MAQRPDLPATELHQWFWGETAMGELIRSIADRMKASDEPTLKYIAYGLVR